MKITILVPVFNEEATIGVVLDHLRDLHFEREVIVIDDGSTDETSAIVRGHDSQLVIEHLPENRGKGAAIRRGIELATGDIFVVQDADLEVLPANIEALVAPIITGVADAVYGSRFLEQAGHVPLSRRLANRLLTAFTNRLYGTRLTDMETAHKAIRTDVLRALDLVSERFEIEVELTAKLARCGARIAEVPSPYNPRTKDEGKKITWRDGVEALATIWRWRRLARRHLPIAEPAGRQDDPA